MVFMGRYSLYTYRTSLNHYCVCERVKPSHLLYVYTIPGVWKAGKQSLLLFGALCDTSGVIVLGMGTIPSISDVL